MSVNLGNDAVSGDRVSSALTSSASSSVPLNPVSPSLLDSAVSAALSISSAVIGSNEQTIDDYSNNDIATLSDTSVADASMKTDTIDAVPSVVGTEHMAVGSGSAIPPHKMHQLVFVYILFAVSLCLVIAVAVKRWELLAWLRWPRSGEPCFPSLITSTSTQPHLSTITSPTTAASNDWLKPLSGALRNGQLWIMDVIQGRISLGTILSDWTQSIRHTLATANNADSDSAQHRYGRLDTMEDDELNDRHSAVELGILSKRNGSADGSNDDDSGDDRMDVALGALNTATAEKKGLLSTPSMAAQQSAASGLQEDGAEHSSAGTSPLVSKSALGGRLSVVTTKPQSSIKAFKPQLKEGTSRILTEEMVAAIYGWLPVNLQWLDWRQIFTTEKDGTSLSTLYGQIEAKAASGSTLFVIEETHGHVFGVFINDPWRSKSGKFFGGADTFVFKCGTRAAAEFRVWHWQSADRYFVHSSANGITIGGGKQPALRLENNFLLGFSNASDTFGNDCLSGPFGEFKPLCVEVWGFEEF